ncbi:unnamed protein product, partial [Rotaria sordida]
NSSVAPLFGVLIYRRAASLELDVDIKQQYEEKAEQFDIHAILIIYQCFDNDENFAIDLLKQPAVAFNDIYPLQLARKINCKSFLASKCVQKYLDYQWNITRFIVLEQLFIVSKIFLCLDLIFWYVRTLELFAAFGKLGPKLIMIFNTVSI